MQLGKLSARPLNSQLPLSDYAKREMTMIRWFLEKTGILAVIREELRQEWHAEMQKLWHKDIEDIRATYRQ